jgi:hypothetical protein
MDAITNLGYSAEFLILISYENCRRISRLNRQKRVPSLCHKKSKDLENYIALKLNSHYKKNPRDHGRQEPQ